MNVWKNWLHAVKGYIYISWCDEQMDACVSYGWGSGDFIKMALGESSSNNVDYVVLSAYTGMQLENKSSLTRFYCC